EREILPAIDKSLAQQGREVYQRYQCHTCHPIIDRSDKKRRVVAQMASLQHIGTDPQMALNAYHYTGRSGHLQGELIDPIKLDGKRFGPTTKVLPALSLATAAVILEPDPDKHFARRWIENGYDLLASLAENPILYTRKHLDFGVVKKSNPDTLLAYKARPLNGIWATAPYLHNGSVANLYELFLPYCAPTNYVQGACRRNHFTVGIREFDPVHVGFIDSEHADLFVFDTRLPGNSNKGHEYAAGNTPVFALDAKGRVVRDVSGQPVMTYLPPISHNERMALIEYLKTL
ncbi:MAG TPA: di-heme-cytochrome C peroxidase, partial [Cellvibrionaceae bacterium]